jgi:hypothetical protein
VKKRKRFPAQEVRGAPARKNDRFRSAGADDYLRLTPLGFSKLTKIERACCIDFYQYSSLLIAIMQ